MQWEGTSHDRLWGKTFPWKGHSKCKDPVVEVSLRCPRSKQTKTGPVCLEHYHPCREEFKTAFLKMAGPPAMLSYQDSISPGCSFGDSGMSLSARMLGMLFLLWPGPACPQLWDSSFIMYFQSSTTPKEAIWQNVQRTLKTFVPFDSMIPHLRI